MTNVVAPRGFVPVRHFGNGCVKTSAHKIASAYDTDIFRGDPVEMVADGTIELAAAANVDNLGVFAGCEYVNATGEQVFSKYWPADTVATSIVAHVYDDPNIVYEIQCDGVFAAADVGQLADWVAGTGSTLSGLSAHELNYSSLASTGKSLRILGLVNRPDNEVGQDAKLEVMFIEHVMRGVVAGVGGI